MTLRKTKKRRKLKTDCLACAIQTGKIDFKGSTIVSTPYFEAQQDYETPIPGFIIIVSKRHIFSIEEFTKEERIDFIEFLYNLRKAIKKTLRVNFVSLIQEENTKNSHFHLWIFPYYGWMNKKFGTGLPAVWQTIEYARDNLKTDKNSKKVWEATNKLKRFLNTKQSKNHSRLA